MVNFAHAKNAADIRQRLFGTWKLVSMKRIMLETGQQSDDYGPNPISYIHYSPDARMINIIVRSDRI